ncbi:MAG: two-component regulator propeller domain-containing protein [Candidatus Hydrogenedentales bacterium]
MNMNIYMKLALILALACHGMVLADDTYLRAPDQCAWSPVSDSVYLQEVGNQVVSDSPIITLAVFDGTVFMSTGEEVYEWDNVSLAPISEAPAGLKRLRVVDDALWGLSGDGLFRYDGYDIEKLSNEGFVDITMVRGKVYAATRNTVYSYESGSLQSIEPEAGFRSTNTTYHMEDGSQILMNPERIGPISRIAEYSETLYVMRPGELVLLDNDLVDPRVADWGMPPSKNFRDMIAMGSRLFVGTDRGLAVLRGMALTSLNGKDGLPYEDITCLAEGFDGDLWIGTTWGAIRYLKDGSFHYFAGKRWLPNDYVNDISISGDAVYIATNGGLGIIKYEPFTLQKKAALYERRLEEWGHKRLGFVHLLYRAGSNEPWMREITDNDGGFTTHYLTAMTYKYAVTQDPKDWEEAVNTLKAMVWLEEITDIPGFVSRAIWSVHGDAGEKAKGGSGGLPARWVPTPDGNFEWKGDTSSDEIGAHYYAMATFCSVAPDGPEKERAREHINRVTRHIVDNGWKLRDKGGELTRWGRWDPEYLQRPYGMYAQGLNGMEAQSYVTTAIGLVGDDYFRDALQQLLDWRYHEHTVRQKLTFPPDDITMWDDQIAFLAYYSLIKYTEKDWLRALYRRSLERSWEIKRLEKHPWFNFLYGAMTGNDCEAEKGVEFLRDWPLDLISYTFKNSQRADLHPEPGYVPYALGPDTDSPKQISPRESEPKKLDSTLLSLDGGSGGNRSISPTAWLECYWMGRYYGMIEAPESTDTRLTGIEERPLRRPLGAAAYDGPPRPF